MNMLSIQNAAFVKTSDRDLLAFIKRHGFYLRPSYGIKSFTIGI